MKNEIKKVVITGGPCSGKSTGMAHIKRTFEDRGYSVLIAPETATYLFSGVGVQLGEGKLDPIALQESLVAQQAFQEANIEQIARQYQGKVLILLDRGILDSRAYLGDDILQPLFTKNGIHIDQVLSGDRYDGVIHLVTAANGAEQFYTTANNEARKETKEEARILDEKTKEAYKGVPKLHIIDNSTSFKEKIERVAEAVSAILGVPHPIETENKYLVQVRDWDFIKSISQEVNIAQYYIDNNSAEERIRKRSIGSGVTYYHTIKQEIPGVPDRVETERIITPREFASFHNRLKSKIEKKRYCFFHNNQYFELDAYDTVSDTFDRSKQVLEIELLKRDDSVEIPDFIEVISDITEDKRFRNSALSVPL